MPTLKIQLEEEHSGQILYLDALCDYRQIFYRDFLQETYINLLHSYQGNTFIKSTVFSADLMEALMTQLDRCVMEHIADAVSKLSEPGLELESINSEHPYFYQSVILPPRLEALYPHYLPRMNLLTDQFLIATKMALNRINEDRIALIRGFFPDFNGNPNTCYLSKVVSTGSDLHKRGQEVMVLEFKNEEGIILGNIIYKPSSVLVDMMIVGNIQHLVERDLLPHIFDHIESSSQQASSSSSSSRSDFPESIAEMLNRLQLEEYTEEHAASSSSSHSTNHPNMPLLPTYLIFPKEKGNVVESYGYITYLPHKPWFKENLPLKLQNAIDSIDGDLAKVDLVTSPILEAYWDSVKNEAILMASAKEDPYSDYIARNDVEYHQYSKQCGLLTGLAWLLGITDLHFQNLILSKLSPTFIDLEVSFQPDGTIDAIGLLDSAHGAMAGKVKSPFEYNYLDPYGQIQYVINDFPDKNLLYRLKEIDEQLDLVPVAPNPKMFMHGFNFILKIICKHHETLASWFVSDFVRKVHIRVLPAPTTDFKNHLKMYLSEEKQNNEAWQKEIFAEFSKEAFNRYSNVLKRKYEEKGKLYLIPSSCVEHPHLYYPPTYIVYKNIGNIERNFHSQNIPVFYMRIDSRQLIDSDGNIVQIDLDMDEQELASPVEPNILSKMIELKESTYSLDCSYFTQSPLEITQYELTKLAKDADYRTSLLSEVAKKAHHAYNSSKMKQNKRESCKQPHIMQSLDSEGENNSNSGCCVSM